jgi:hypothetical protein
MGSRVISRGKLVTFSRIAHHIVANGLVPAVPLNDRQLTDLRLRLIAHSCSDEDDRQVEPILAAMALASREKYAQLGLFVTEVHTDTRDFRAMVALIVRTMYGRSRPDPDLRTVLRSGQPDNNRNDPVVDLGVEVFIAIASGRLETAWRLLDGPDDRPENVRATHRCLVLGLLLRWLNVRAHAGFPSPDRGKPPEIIMS